MKLQNKVAAVSRILGCYTVVKPIIEFLNRALKIRIISQEDSSYFEK